MLKNRYFWPFLAKMGKKGLFAGYTPKMAILALFGAPEGLVLHQPLARGPGRPLGLRRPLPGPGDPGDQVPDLPDRVRDLSWGLPQGYPARGPGDRARGRPALGGFTSTPRAGALHPAWPDPGTGVPRRALRSLDFHPRPGGDQTQTSQTSQTGDRAPPRGVDVKPPPTGIPVRDF